MFKILENRIKIIDSYKMSKEEFDMVLEEVKKLAPSHVAFNRTKKSIYLEWYAHNLLYRLGIRKDKTADVDLDYPQPWIKRLGYGILGIIGKIILNKKNLGAAN